jgi:hypothetical protein
LKTTVAISDPIPKWALMFQFKIVKVFKLKVNYEEWRRLKVEDRLSGRGKREEGNSRAQNTIQRERER